MCGFKKPKNKIDDKQKNADKTETEKQKNSRYMTHPNNTHQKTKGKKNKSPEALAHMRNTHVEQQKNVFQVMQSKKQNISIYKELNR